MATVTRTPLLESSATPQPAEQLHRWLADARSANLPLPTVASLATAALPSGRVSNRMVVVREITPDGGLVVYSDWDRSHKGRDASSNPSAAVTFYWRELDRSLRVEGRIRRMSETESAAFFRARPHEFQAGVSLGNQSQPAPDRCVVEARLRELDNTPNLPIPSYWGGAVIVPDYFEFWQGRDDRIHDRLEYALQDDGQWSRNRLTP